MASEQLLPAEQAARTAEQMSTFGVGETILSETVQSAIDGEGLRESGRTWCSSDADGQLREPFARYPAAVDLAGCPSGDVIAVWHTHTTPGQLRNPEHSLPDIANVVFGDVDASIIPGTESDHILVAAADRERMRQEFRNLLGSEVDTTAEVSDAITSDRISAPSRVRDRMNDAFAPLMRRVEVSRPELRAAVDDVLDADTETSAEPICEGHDEVKCDPDTPGGDTVPENTATALRSASVFRREARVASHGLRETLDGYDVTGTVVGTTVGMFTSRLLERAVFGE
jgi:hypothetical protein